MAHLAARGDLGGGEGVDAGFRPDAAIGEGDRIAAGGAVLDVLHTPGHFAGHLSLALGDAVLIGDHVMSWASTLISPPDGDLASFRATSARLRVRADRIFYPGHGAPVTDPAARLDWLVAHRAGREAAILQALARGPFTVEDIARLVYTDLAAPMLPAACRNVLAHLIDLEEKGVVLPETAPDACGRFRLA
jgi:glyoxylase-like metal-dependent hydrolase (beta-lactamase superfamily II)